MPNYSSHLIFNFFLLILIVPLYLQLEPFLTPIQLYIFLLFYFIGSAYLTPDMDTKSEAQQRCGIFCFPYRKASKHRGASHHWLLGTLSRIIYILLIISLFILIIYGRDGIYSFINALILYKKEMVIASSGMFLSNLFHIILDYLNK